MTISPFSSTYTESITPSNTISSLASSSMPPSPSPSRSSVLPLKRSSMPSRFTIILLSGLNTDFTEPRSNWWSVLRKMPENSTRSFTFRSQGISARPVPEKVPLPPFTSRAVTSTSPALNTSPQLSSSKRAWFSRSKAPGPTPQVKLTRGTSEVAMFTVSEGTPFKDTQMPTTWNSYSVWGKRPSTTTLRPRRGKYSSDRLYSNVLIINCYKKTKRSKRDALNHFLFFNEPYCKLGPDKGLH